MDKLRMHNEGILKIMADKEKDEIVLSFHDSLLHDSDVLLLNDGQWLNDNLIGFMFEYFEHEQFQGASEEILFISPNVTQFIKLADGPEVGIFLGPLNLPKHKLLFFVINDNESKTSTGGSHWSLLLYSRDKNMFTHYDSFLDNNKDAAKSMAKNIQPFLNAVDVPTFVNGKCPQQQNGCDCGMYVISITEHLCKEYLGLTSAPLTNTVNASTVSEKRQYMKKLILQLAPTH